MLRARLTALAPSLGFVTLAVSLTWLSAALLADAFAPRAEASPSTLLHAALLYAAIVGWQPLVALALVTRIERQRQRQLDYGLRPAAAGWPLLSIAVAIALLAAAAAADALLSHATRNAQPPLALDGSWARAASTFAAFAGVIAVLWLQAIAEELAWRGYLLARLMRTLGPWPGLVFHGALWGLCYAPVLAVTVGGAGRIAGFVITCSLLGVVLGWLRLASGSIYASAASNATLTICAGLPLVLQGASPYLVAVFEPVGWLPLLAAIALLASRASWRSRIAVPSRRVPDHIN